MKDAEALARADDDYRLMYYRDKDNYEVDFVMENHAGKLIGIEVKAAASVSKSDLPGLRRFRQVAGESFLSGIVMFDGTKTLPLGNIFERPRLLYCGM